MEASEEPQTLAHSHAQSPNLVEKGEQLPAENTSKQIPPSLRKTKGLAWVLVVASTLSSILLYTLDNTIVANVIPSVIKDLGQAEELSWISVGYMIGGLAGALPYGNLYALFDAKWLYIVCIVLFLTGSALRGAAPNMAAMIVGRVIAGVGGNGMYVGVLTLISVKTSNKERPMYLSFMSEKQSGLRRWHRHRSHHWRCLCQLMRNLALGFYINLVIGGVFSPVYIFVLPSFDPLKGRSVIDRLKPYDGVGTVLSIVGLLCPIMAIDFGETLYSWKSGSTIVLFVVGGLALIAFALQQTFKWLTTEQNRLFPVHFVRMKEPELLFILMAANNCSSMVSMYYVPLYFQFTRGVQSLDSGVRLPPLIVVAAVFILANGAIMSATGYYKPWYIVGTVFILTGGVFMFRLTIDTADWYTYGFELMVGVGLGCFLQAGYAVMQGILEPVHMAFGVSFMLFAQVLGISLGLSIDGALFTNTALKNLAPVLPGISRSQLQSALSGTAGDFLAGFDSETSRHALDIIVSAIDNTFILVYVAGAIGLIAPILLSKVSRWC